MTIKTLHKSQKTTIKKLQEDISLLRSFIIGNLGKDMEGEYKPEFVKKILEAAKEKPEFVFDKKTFLKQIRD